MKKLIACLAAALCGASAAAGASGLRGPLVAVPHCTVVVEGCGLDPATPDLNPAGCAMNLSRQMERRGVRTEVIGPGAVVCGEGSNALLLEGHLTAHCPDRARDEMLLDQVLSVRLELEIELRDCFSGEVLGRGRTERAIESGRHTLVRDAVEELSHHTRDMKVRRLFPETPLRWMKADVGGERSFEISWGLIDIGKSGVNDFLETVRIDREEEAQRIGWELAYNPVSTQRTRVGFGMEYLRVRAEDDGSFTLADIDRVGEKSQDPNQRPHQNFDPNVPHRVEMDLQVIGIRGSVAHGFDITQHQRLSVQAAVGYYVLGNGAAPATVMIEGLPSGSDKLKQASPMLEGGLRYTWRFTSHLALTAGYGYTWLEYSSPNRRGRAASFPFDLDFTGVSARVGLAGRF